MVVSPFAVMSLFKYFKREAAVDRGEFLPEETDRSTSIANQEVRAVVDEAKAKPKRRKVEPCLYSAETRAAIGKYASINGPTAAARDFSKKLGHPVPESMARKYRGLYLSELEKQRQSTS